MIKWGKWTSWIRCGKTWGEVCTCGQVVQREIKVIDGEVFERRKPYKRKDTKMAKKLKELEGLST